MYIPNLQPSYKLWGNRSDCGKKVPEHSEGYPVTIFRFIAIFIKKNLWLCNLARKIDW